MSRDEVLSIPDAWKKIIYAMLLRRSTRKYADAALMAILHLWPSPEALCRANELELEAITMSCGLYRSKARRMIRFSSLWLSDSWIDVQDLPGVSDFVMEFLHARKVAITAQKCHAETKDW